MEKNLEGRVNRYRDVFRKQKEEHVRKKDIRKLKNSPRHGLTGFLKVMKHFFPDLADWIMGMEDPRHPGYVMYPQSILVMMGIMKNVMGIKSMREMQLKTNTDEAISNLAYLSGAENADKMQNLPTYTALNDYLARLDPSQLSGLRHKMALKLLEINALRQKRLLGKSVRVILDGTGLFHFDYKHCEHCLRSRIPDHLKKPGGGSEWYYYHKVLEAKAVLSDNLVISLGTEFIENENEDVKKQDCENAAAKRLMQRLKEEFPRLRICIQGDSLYAAEPIMKICREYRWDYIFMSKDGTQKTVHEMYDYLKEARTVVENLCGKEKGTGGFLNGVHETAGKTEVMNVFEYTHTIKTKEDGEETEKDVHFLWITNIEITKKNLQEMIIAARGRWKIETSFFNQKCGTYRIEHQNSKNPNAMKNHYLLTQIADILMSLYCAWSEVVKTAPEEKKEIPSLLYICFSGQFLTEEGIHYIEGRTSVYLE